ncbi:unnamed protein product [Lota lota]
MEEGADQNENDHKVENENSELEKDDIHEATMVNSSEELFKSPNHNDETAMEEKPIEKDTQSGDLGVGLVDEGRPSAAKFAEEAEPTEPEGEHEDQNDLDITSASLVSEDGEATPEMDLLSREDSVGFKSPGASDLETPDLETLSNASHEEDGCEKETPVTATLDEVEEGVDAIDANVQLYDQLCAERENLSQHSGKLQTKIAENSMFWKNTGGDAQPEEGIHVLYKQQQSYEMYLTRLGDLKLKEQAEELKLQTQELQQVESEWRELMALKRHAAMTALGPHAAHAVDEVLTCEQKCVDELVAAKLANVKSKKKNRVPQTGAAGNMDNMSDMLQMIEQKKERQLLGEKCDEDLLKIRKNIATTMQVTVHIRENLQWIQAENQAKKAQLAHWEGLLAQKRELLTGAKRARNRLRSHTLELKQRCGMLGNLALLRDFEDQMDACGHLEGDEGGLRRRHSETTLKCARWKKKLGTS